MSVFTRKPIPEDNSESSDELAPVPYNAPRPLVASAATVNMKSKKEVDAINKRKATDKWQQEAWEYYDLIGEIKASANLIANVLSRINLYVGFITDTAYVPSKIDEVENLDPTFIEKAKNKLYMLESGNGGTSGLLRDAALNLFVVGECYLVKEPARSEDDVEKWQIRSIDEVVSTTGRKAGVAIKPRKDSKPNEFLPLPDTGGYISRLWRTHPRYGDEADSSMRGILDICDELLLLGRTSRATAKSRLNAGMLFLPDTITNAADSDSDDPDAPENDADSFEEQLVDNMVTPIADETSAASVVPIVVSGPESAAENIKFIKFERAFDPQLVQRAEKLLDRILAGLDIPLDVAKGLSGVKYSNAILIEEQLYKAHVEPLILMIVDCLTIGFLRPALRATKMFDEELISRAVVWYDPSAITAKPSKAEAASLGYDKGIVSARAWLKYNGFSEGDAPDKLEQAQRFAKDRGQLDQGLTQMLVELLLPPEIVERARQNSLSQSDPASANALTNALGGVPATPGEENRSSAPSDVEDPATTSSPLTDPPPDLIQ